MRRGGWNPVPERLVAAFSEEKRLIVFVFTNKRPAAAVLIPYLLGLWFLATTYYMFISPPSQWFKDLKKPWWEPSVPIFGVLWVGMYPPIGMASYLVWAEGGFHRQTRPLVLYAVQLFLNFLWPMLFLGWENLGLALFNIVALVGVLVATIKAFKPVNEHAANLMKPYLAWILFVTLLNFNLWYTNRGTNNS